MGWITNSWQQLSNDNKKIRKPFQCGRFVELLKQNMKDILGARHISCNQYSTLIKVLCFPFWQPWVPVNVYHYQSVKSYSVHWLLWGWQLFAVLTCRELSLLGIQRSLRKPCLSLPTPVTVHVFNSHHINLPGSVVACESAENSNTSLLSVMSPSCRCEEKILKSFISSCFPSVLL